MKIYTKTGDDGTTGLLYGGRVSKNDLRTEAYGTTDEAVAMIGLARSFGPVAKDLEQMLLDVQRHLFVVGAELATNKANAGKLELGVSKVSDEMVGDMESWIDSMVAVSPLPEYFIVPGACQVSAALDVARAVVRRAERLAVALREHDMLSGPTVVHYLNRLSDLLFVAARTEEKARAIDAPRSRDLPTT
ncbi:MAG: cob(I)yrinic acid a,c-diamide adenosyltransferase [Actinomycetota bacterium]|nr:cob(I)yrinic acid a,c-diamide adenosyltransferase [Actinomycetota bacterium]